MTRSGNIPAHLALGRAGEETALVLLQQKGIRLLAKNWRPKGVSRGLELDLVGEQDGVVLFVEVKTRRLRAVAERGEGFGPEDNFTPRKRANFVRAARCFLSDFDLWEKPCRFDLVCVTFFPQGPPKLEHYVHVIESGTLVGGGDTAWQPW